MKRVLVVNMFLGPRGGGNCVTAWALEGLRADHDVTLLTWAPPDLEGVNRTFGTSLRPGDFRSRTAPRALRGLVAVLPVPATMLTLGLLMRLARRLLVRERFDAVIGTQNEMDFGRRGAQYVHYPLMREPRPAQDLRWYHDLPLALPLYRAAYRAIAGYTDEGMRRNLTLVNSDWTGRHYRRWHGADCVTLYPPVPGEVEPRPWDERESAFVAIGRFSPEKRLEEVIHTLALVRRRGHPVRLHLVGSPDHPRYTRRILRLAARERDWVEVRFDLRRADLLALLARQRYGIHAMHGEHFGIAAAEMQRAGCIVFVNADGGPAEIVGGEPRQIFADPEEGAARIERVLADRALQDELHRAALARSRTFTTERFVSGIRAAVAEVAIAPGAVCARR